MSDYNKSNGIGTLHAGGNFSAAAAAVGKVRGITTAALGAAGQFAIVLGPEYAIDAGRSVVRADVRGAVPGVAEVAHLSDTTLGVFTFSAAGAAVSLPWNLSIKRKFGGGRTTYSPAGDQVASALIDVVDTVVTPVGPMRGLALLTPVVRTGAGVYTVTLDAGGIDPLNALVSVRPASTLAVPLDAIVVAEHTTDTSITVRSFNGGTPEDVNFYLEVERIAVG